MASGSKKVIYAALLGNSLVAATKFVAAAVTGSSAMLSEGIHSLVNISVDMADTATAGDIEKAIAAFDRRIKSRFPAIKRVFVEAEARSRKSKIES